jgi:Uma2 family endonuclease
MTMATESRVVPTVGEHRFLMRGVGWRGYETLLELIGNRPIRLTYSQGDVELMSPLWIHERYSEVLGQFVSVLTEELGMPRVSGGSTTFKSELVDRGLEPDKCSYITNAFRLRPAERLDLAVDPPPDLAIEIEITSSALDRMGIYAALGVPEVWRFDGEILSCHRLQAVGKYEISPTSGLFPGLSIDELPPWLQMLNPKDEVPLIRNFRAWVRDEILPRYPVNEEH